MIYLRITISRLFVCLPTLELETFEPQVCSTKIDYAQMQTAAKETKRDQVVAQLFLNFVSLRDLFGVKTKLKDSLLKSNNQINTTFVTRT